MNDGPRDSGAGTGAGAAAREDGRGAPPPAADDLLAVVRGPSGLGLADARRAWAVPARGPVEASAVLAALERDRSPRWVLWSSRELLVPLLRVAPDLRLARAWDLVAVHRLLAGGAEDAPSTVHADAAGLDPRGAPAAGQLDLAGDGATDVPEEDDGPLRADGHVRGDWADGGWSDTPRRAARWAALALATAGRQHAQLTAGAGAGSAGALQTARSESAAALLAVELGAGGLPFDVAAAREVVDRLVGPPPRDEREAAARRADRDAPVLALLGDPGVDLRSPHQVRAALEELGLDLPDTRSWRLEQMAAEPGAPAVLAALLAWRQRERFAVASGHRWLEEHVAGGRLRASWSASDGGAGRMTASGGVHSLPRELRGAVRAEPGHLLVRADLGQVEPRVLAVVSGDAGLARAAEADDLYSPVAARLGVAREVAKVAVLAAMYGQTSGAAGEALAAMERAYPVATGFLVDAARRGAAGEDVRTAGGRRVRGRAVDDVPVEAGTVALDRHRQALAARGRYTRNAVVQGSAAELFKAWAATVRARLLAGEDGEVVLCLHDELLLHVRAGAAERVARELVADLGAASSRWCRAVGGPPVRFTADVAVVERWSQAKG
ncbi:DNA polymerase [Pseudokineococcus basanitobsidens]|uniref:DNA-directed DNA polymerase n=1 Tax=Pseudokineococcus basanitobsidens TaxID=1926649 RepID=A0ABU8RN63_9ACTN